MKVEYIAFDGKRFTTAKECKQHEAECGARVMMYDGHCDYTPNMENAVYIFISSLEDFDILKEIANEQKQTIAGIEGAGFWVWDDWRGEYTKIRYMKYRLDDIVTLMSESKADYKTIMGKEYNEDED